MASRAAGRGGSPTGRGWQPVGAWLLMATTSPWRRCEGACGVVWAACAVQDLVQRAWAAAGGAAGGLSAHWARGTGVGLAAGGRPISI
jgi:hypothetical protein